jgi:hypothetical protein
MNPTVKPISIQLIPGLQVIPWTGVAWAGPLQLVQDLGQNYWLVQYCSTGRKAKLRIQPGSLIATTQGYRPWMWHAIAIHGA